MIVGAAPWRNDFYLYDTRMDINDKYLEKNNMNNNSLVTRMDDIYYLFIERLYIWVTIF